LSLNHVSSLRIEPITTSFMFQSRVASLLILTFRSDPPSRVWTSLRYSRHPGIIGNDACIRLRRSHGLRETHLDIHKLIYCAVMALEINRSGKSLLAATKLTRTIRCIPGSSYVMAIPMKERKTQYVLLALPRHAVGVRAWVNRSASFRP
jgi:hypothetical protein